MNKTEPAKWQLRTCVAGSRAQNALGGVNYRMAETCNLGAEMWDCNSQELSVWDAGQVWTGHMHSLRKSEGEYGGTQETQTVRYFLKKARRSKKK